jgi:hypothetical protein
VFRLRGLFFFAEEIVEPEFSPRQKLSPAKNPSVAVRKKKRQLPPTKKSSFRTK